MASLCFVYVSFWAAQHSVASSPLPSISSGLKECIGLSYLRRELAMSRMGTGLLRDMLVARGPSFHETPE